MGPRTSKPVSEGIGKVTSLVSQPPQQITDSLWSQSARRGMFTLGIGDLLPDGWRDVRRYRTRTWHPPWTQPGIPRESIALRVDRDPSCSRAAVGAVVGCRRTWRPHPSGPELTAPSNAKPPGVFRRRRHEEDPYWRCLRGREAGRRVKGRGFCHRLRRRGLLQRKLVIPSAGAIGPINRGR